MGLARRGTMAPRKQQMYSGRVAHAVRGEGRVEDTTPAAMASGRMGVASPVAMTHRLYMACGHDVMMA